MGVGWGGDEPYIVGLLAAERCVCEYYIDINMTATS